MKDPIKRLIDGIDAQMEQRIRNAAQRGGRRSFLATLGKVIVGGSLLPMLPYDRSVGAGVTRAVMAAGTDDSRCEYWAYCSLDGTRCSACGGSANECPPGSQPSVLSWVGTCKNPVDNKDNLVVYSDCCGKTDCDVPADAFCSRSEHERPGYRMGTYNDANWCMANTKLGAHCSTAVIVGIADSG